jgi:N-formylglutamate amidohydrolase
VNKYITVKTDGSLPVLAVALHNGHRIRDNIKGLLALNDAERLREEDPFTGIWTHISGNRIIAHYSRFEFDLNRRPLKSVYVYPEDAWGLEVWNGPLPKEIIIESNYHYKQIYREIHRTLNKLVHRFGKLMVYDLHSYNHRRSGPDNPPEDPEMNPEINIGTGTMDRKYWGSLVDRFINDLREYNFMDRSLDVRENIRFRGGYFPNWIHQNYARSICCISIEVKKFFMDEWTGKPDNVVIQALSEAFRETIPGVVEEICNRMPEVKKTGSE